jgi:hypothetical protein
MSIRRWLSEFPICVPFCIRCYNQFCSFFLLNFFICFWLVIWFIQLLFIGVECGFRNGLMIGGRPMRTENNWQTAAEHRQGHGTNILDKLKEGHVPFFFFFFNYLVTAFERLPDLSKNIEWLCDGCPAVCTRNPLWFVTVEVFNIKVAKGKIGKKKPNEEMKWRVR